MRTRGVGSLFQPSYIDKRTGQRKRQAVWWICYSHRGIKHRESSNSTSRKDAQALLKLRIGQAGIGKPVSAATRHTTLNDLAELVFTDYRENEYDTLARQEDAFNHLRDFFGGDCLAEEITTTRISDYKAWRKEQPNRLHTKNPKIGCAIATVNRELAALRHAFALASRHQPPLITNAPYIPLSRERNRRMGFFEWEQFKAVRDHLPDYLKGLMTAAYYTGWRVPSELLTREKKHLVGDMLVLHASETKNEEPRQFPLQVIPELREVIEQQLEATRKLEIESGRVIPLLFHNRGNPIVDYLPAWHRACAAAGVAGRIPHDFRRTAARNLINSGVDPLTTMALVGWEDPAMLKRYNIINDETLKRGVAKLSAYLDEQKARPARVERIGARSGQGRGTSDALAD